jgi:protein-disulfide isomerase
MTRYTFGLAFVAAMVVAGCQGSGTTSAPTSTTGESAGGGSGGAVASKEEVSRRIEEYFGKSVTPGIVLRVTDVSPAEVPGWNKGSLDVSAGGNTQTMTFLVSQDGRYFISGEITDLTVDPLKATMEKIDLKGVPGRGPVDAKVTIVEYSDFQCPFCSRGYQIFEEQVMPEYKDKVRFYFKNLPLKSIHPWAENAALATGCAAKQNDEAFWKMYHSIFKNQREINQDNLKDKVTKYAEEAGLDGAKFAQCYDSKEALADVEKDLTEAAAVGANSTPTFFINGRRLEGAQPFENFKAIIDAELG